MQPVRTSAWLWPLRGMAVFSAVFASGCAGTTWLERSITAELPVDAPSRAYPTAITSPSSPNAAVTRPAAYSISDDSPADEGPANAASAAANVAPSKHQPAAARDRQTANMPVLAVVPPQLVARAATTAAPQAAPAPPTSPVSPPQAETAAEPPLAVASSNSASREPTVASAVQPGLSLTSQTTINPGRQDAPRGSVATAAATIPAALDASQASATRLDAAGEAPSLDKARSEWINALEAEIRRRRESDSSDEELPHLEQQLRLGYVAAGRLDEAAAEIESLDAAQREAYKNLMFGLGIWLSPDEARRAPLRTAKVLHSLRDATTDLAGSSKLELRSLVFCERVDYFGWYTEFPRKEFQPKQQVLLYVEVQNFAAEHKGPGGYETELQGSYEILDASGQIIASRQLPLDKEICRNYRRDYFLAYRIYMPDNIEPGHYRLELTVEDLKARGKFQGRKLGEGMIEFTVR